METKLKELCVEFVKWTTSPPFPSLPLNAQTAMWKLVSHFEETDESFRDWMNEHGSESIPL